MVYHNRTKLENTGIFRSTWQHTMIRATIHSDQKIVETTPIVCPGVRLILMEWQLIAYEIQCDKP